jgi:hypothetical protein
MVFVLRGEVECVEIVGDGVDFNGSLRTVGCDDECEDWGFFTEGGKGGRGLSGGFRNGVVVCAVTVEFDDDTASTELLFLNQKHSNQIEIFVLLSIHTHVLKYSLIQLQFDQLLLYE